MATILNQIENNLSAAMKEKAELIKNGSDVSTVDSLISTLRLIKSELIKANNKADYTLDETQEIKTLMKMCAQREDSIEQYTKGGRNELADNEKNELAIIKGYMPTMPSDSDIKTATNDAIQALVAEKGEGYTVSMRDMGAIMKTVKAKYPTANGNLVKETLLSYGK